MKKRLLIIGGFLAVVVAVYLMLPKPETMVRITPHDQVLNKNLGMGFQYWLNNDELLVQDDIRNANGELQGCQFSRYNLNERKRTLIPGLAEKLGKLVIRWQLSPDKERLLAVVKNGDNFEFVTTKLDGSEVVRVPATISGEYFCGWAADSKGWYEFQERYKDKLPNIILHGLDGKEIPPSKTSALMIPQMRLRSYQNMLPNGNFYEIPYMEAGAEESLALHLQLKNFKDSSVPLKEFEIKLPKGMHTEAFAISPDRTTVALLGDTAKGGGPEGADYADRLMIARMDTKKAQQVALETISLDIATRSDADRHLLLSWSPDGKKIGYCVDGEFRVVDYAGFAGGSPPASSALPME